MTWVHDGLEKDVTSGELRCLFSLVDGMLRATRSSVDVTICVVPIQSCTTAEENALEFFVEQVYGLFFALQPLDRILCGVA